MKTHRRALACILAAMMLMALLTACSGGTPSAATTGTTAGATTAAATTAAGTTAAATSGTTAAATAAADPNAPQDKVYRISWIGAQNSPLCENPVMIEYWNDFFNVEIDFWSIDSTSWNDVLATKFAAGEFPDVMYVNSLNNLSNYMDQGLLAEIPQEMMDTYMPVTISKITADYPKLLKIGQSDGKQYTIPVGVNAACLFREPMCYRGDWMENLGVTDAPETLDEFVELMRKFTFDDPDGNGKNDTHGFSSTGMAMVYGAFGVQRSQWNDVGGQLVYSSTREEMKQALSVLADLYREGVIDPEWITGENTGGYWATSNAFVEGRIGYSGLGNYYHWQPNQGEYNEETKTYSKLQAGTNVAELAKIDEDAAGKIVQGQPVTGPEGKSGGVGWPLPHPHSVGFSAHMSKELDKMAKVMTMYEYWTSEKDHWFAARYGIEGEMWHYNEDGVPVSDFKKWKIEQGFEDDDTITLPGVGAHTVLECFIPSEYTSVEQTYQQQWARENGYDKNIIYDEKFVTFPSSSLYQTELDKIESEAFIAIITGQQPVDYFDTFVAEWTSFGGDVLTQEANDWWVTMQ